MSYHSQIFIHPFKTVFKDQENISKHDLYNLLEILIKTVIVAKAEGVGIHCPIDGLYSFFNSPYPAHRLHTGVDIYNGSDFGEVIASPVNGVVKMIRKVKAPKGQGFVDSGHDSLILLEPDDNADAIVKLLHVDPLVEIGDRVTVNNVIGVLLRSGYYGWGTSPHIHVEIRNPSDPLRARGGYTLRRANTPLNAEESSRIEGYVIRTKLEYSLIRLKNNNYGLAGEINGSVGIIDGGIPYYGWMGIHLDRPTSGEVKLLGKKIGVVTDVYPLSCIADVDDFRLLLNGIPVMGLSLYLSPICRSFAKVLPTKIGALNLEVGQQVEIKVLSMGKSS
jgi:hypothetical protein